jgi:hypothetical protein
MKEDGVLHAFNNEYRKRRLAAAAAGRGFMRYDAAWARLQKLAFQIMADDNRRLDRSLISAVFDT